jgi:hypothetical protein
MAFGGLEVSAIAAADMFVGFRMAQFIKVVVVVHG